MSELKVYHHELRHNEYEEFYLKYEADKVIADLEESHKKEVGQLLIEIVKLKKSIGKLLKSNLKQVMDEVLQKTLIYGSGFVPVEHAMKLIAEIRHQKYKRCLAMADYAMYHHFRKLYIYGKSLDNDKAVFKINYGLRWRSRWLALADQFTDKEAK